jgi:hypothetical protein
MGYGFLGRRLYEQVDMVSLYIRLFHLPTIHVGTLMEQLIQPRGEWASEYPFCDTSAPTLRDTGGGGSCVRLWYIVPCSRTKHALLGPKGHFVEVFSPFSLC